MAPGAAQEPLGERQRQWDPKTQAGFGFRVLGFRPRVLGPVFRVREAIRFV